MSNLSKEAVSTKEVKLGEVFNIEIEGNRTTGFAWALAQMPSNFYLLSTSYPPNPYQPGMVGVGGTSIFTFKAIEKSEEGVEVVFKHIRPWMNDGGNTKIWKVKVTNGVHYERLEGCFVNNTVKAGLFHLAIDNVETFNDYFGNAGHYGPWLKASDFEKHLVVAVILPTEGRLRELTVNSLAVSDKNLMLDYSVSEGKPLDSWKARVPLILLVDKGNYNTVSFHDNEKKVNQVQL